MKPEARSRADVAADQGLFNDYMATAAKKGTWPEQPAAVPAFAIPHASHRGGRSYPEGGDRQPDQYEPLSDDEIARRNAVLTSPGHFAAHAVAQAAADRAATRRRATDSGNNRYPEAIQRAREERRKNPS